MTLKKFSDYSSYCQWFKLNHPDLNLITEEQFYQSYRYAGRSNTSSQTEMVNHESLLHNPSSIEKFSDYSSYLKWFLKENPTLSAMTEKTFYNSVRYQKPAESQQSKSIKSSQVNKPLASQNSSHLNNEILDLNIMMTLRLLKGGTARQVSQRLNIDQSVIQSKLDQLEAENFVVAEREAGKETHYQA